MASASGNAGSAPGVGLPVGAKVGKYEVVERRGIGGQAIVYKCYDRSLDRFVAIKQISPHLAEDAKFVERFRREAQILARLGAEGTSIVAIHELLEEPAGLFIVMEFVGGHTLETILQDTAGPTEPKAALQVLWRLAAALHVVHAAGIIHRDLKPGNIIISEGLRPKIADFGVAASRSGQTSMLLGTTKYMAPELFGGGEVDGRADLYSLGIIAYELLLGRPKFKEVFEEVTRDPHSEALRWMKWHSNDQESAPPLHTLNPAIPEALSRIVARMMAKKTQDRYAGMEALGLAIRVAFSPRAKAEAAAAGSRAKGGRSRAAAAGDMSAGEGEDLEIQAPPKTAPIPRKPVSLRAKVLLAGGAFSLVLCGVIVLLVRSAQNTARIEVAARNAYLASEECYKAGNFEEALAGFEGLLPKYPDTRQAFQASVLVPLCRARLAEQTAVTNEEWDSVAREEQAARTQAQKVQATRKDLDRWVHDQISEIDDLERNRTRLKRYRTEMARAEEALKAGRFTDASKVLDQLTGDLTDEQKKGRDALKQKAARAEFDRTFAEAVAKGDELGSPEDFKKDLDYDAAKASYDRALNMVKGAGVILEPNEVSAMSRDLSQKTGMLARKRDYRKALKDLEAADTPAKKLQALRTIYGIAPTPEVKKQIDEAQADNFVSKANEALAAGKPAEAKQQAQQALKVVPNYPPAVQVLEKLTKGERRQQLITEGGGLLAQANYAEALRKFLEAADLGSDEDLANKILDCRFQLQLAEADRLRDDKKYDEAIAALEKALALRPSEATMIEGRQTAVKKARDYSNSFAKGEEAMKAGQFGAARAFFMQAKALRAPPPPEVLQRLALASYSESVELGKTAMGKKDYDGALAYFKGAKGQQKDAGVDPAEIDALIAQAENAIKGASP